MKQPRLPQWGRPEISVRPAEVADCDVLAEMHSDAFRRGWSGAEFEALLVQPGVHALIADFRNAFGWRSAAGFALYRLVRDEAEILSVAVIPDCRRRGIAYSRVMADDDIVDTLLRGWQREGLLR